jgi:3-hydroxyanthranilate 3,4-dioxygenase
MKLPAKLNLARWIQQNAKDLKPPVSNKQLFNDAADVIVFVSGGPNTRNDFHVNPTEELFLQLKGDIAVRVRPLDGGEPHDIVVKDGEMFMLPRWLPHRPQRPAGTVGLIMEFPRGFDAEGNPQKDALRWYCPACDAPVYEAQWVLRKIDEDLKIIMEQFWQGPADRRTCRSCGTVIERGTAIELAKGAVGPARAGKSKLEIRNSKKAVKGKKSKVEGRKSNARAKAKAKPRKRIVARRR